VLTLEDARIDVANQRLWPGAAVVRGVREFYAADEAGRCVAAMAMLMESAAGRAFGNLFLTVGPPKFPLKRFTVMDDAIAWLHKFGPR